MKMSISNKKDQKEIVSAVAKIPGQKEDPLLFSCFQPIFGTGFPNVSEILNLFTKKFF